MDLQGSFRGSWDLPKTALDSGNDSKINEVEVPMNFVEFAERYWEEAKTIVDSTQEPQQSKTVPFMSWECKSYCSYSKVCNNPANPNYEGAS